MEALRQFGYAMLLGPFPVVVWFGFTALVLFLAAASIASLKKQVPLFRRVSVRVHRAMAVVALLLALFHLLLALTTYI
jgi:hypothetical protein